MMSDFNGGPGAGAKLKKEKIGEGVAADSGGDTNYPLFWDSCHFFFKIALNIFY